MKENRYQIGDAVTVTPKDGDLFNHDFQGTIAGFREKFIEVKDQEDHVWDCDPDQVQRVES